MKAQIRTMLETHLANLDDFQTAWEGVVNRLSLPYQAVFLQIATSETASISDRPYGKDNGFLQITLYFANGNGVAEIEQRANRLRHHFFGLTKIEKGVQVVVNTPPVIGGLFLLDDKLALPITVNFTAYELESELENDLELNPETEPESESELKQEAL